MFVIVIAVTVALIIFFGAWAVAADAEGRELTFALTGSALEDSGVTGDGSGAQAQNAFGAAPIGETSDEALSETWWGQGFLKACPLH